MKILTAPIKPVGDSFEDEPPFPPFEPKLTDTKVTGLVLGRIAVPGTRAAALPPTAFSPRLIIDLLSTMTIPALKKSDRNGQGEIFKKSKGSKHPRLSPFPGRRVPIGLRRTEPPAWTNPLNALMQFMIFLPGLADLFGLAPRCFQPFIEFVDQYLLDQEENRPISHANSATLLRCLGKNLSLHFHKSPARIDLYEIFSSLVEIIFYQSSPNPVNFCQGSSIAFHPEWSISWEVAGRQTLADAIKMKSMARPLEILVAVRGRDGISCPLIHKQFISEADCLCYDLDAFIEFRPNGLGDVHYIAYVKLDGVWYQCDDDRIAALRSNCLPLHRSVLLHYKKIRLTKATRY